LKCWTTGRSKIKSNRKVHRRQRRKSKELSSMLKKRRLSYSRRTRILTVNWWQSGGDTRYLFVPCEVLYDSNCNVKEIVMERIELLETINCATQNWKTVVDTRIDGVSFDLYSEADVFSLRLRRTYLAVALKQFVANVTGDMRTHWSWKDCLIYAIRAMNDVGIEFFSSFANLAHWRRKLAQNRIFFYNAPEPSKTAYPPFLLRQP
jgi:hypothetical protein